MTKSVDIGTRKLVGSVRNKYGVECLELCYTYTTHRGDEDACNQAIYIPIDDTADAVADVLQWCVDTLKASRK